MDECKPLPVGGRGAPRSAGRGLHSSTSRLNLSAFCGIGGAFRGCLGVIQVEAFRGCLGVIYTSGGTGYVMGYTSGGRGYKGMFRVRFMSETVQVELKSGRV